MRIRTALLTAGLLLPSLALAGFNASSFRKTSRTSSSSPYAPQFAMDGDPTSAWQVDPEVPNEGQWIELDVPVGTVDKVAMIVGWTENDEKFKDYARIKAGKIELFDMADGGDGKKVLEKAFSVEDVQTFQVIDLEDTRVGGEVFGGRIRITITEVYPGKDFPSLAVSELLVHMKEFDAGSAAITMPPASLEGHDAEKMFDDSTRTAWVSDGAGDGVTFEVDAERFGMSSIGFYPGSKTYARPKTVKLTMANLTNTVVLEDKTGWQYFTLPAVVGYTGSAYGPLQIEIVDTYAGSKPNVSIAEINIKATIYEEF